jgi:cobyric acid synthase
VAGFIVNRFRGRASLLRDAFDYTERHTGKPVYGVVPYLARLGLPEEDSLGFNESISNAADAADDLEPALDRLAETVRQSLRMDDLYRLMGLR